jgi:hypothetical protein
MRGEVAEIAQKQQQGKYRNSKKNREKRVEVNRAPVHPKYPHLHRASSVNKERALVFAGFLRFLSRRRWRRTAGPWTAQLSH